MEAGRDMDAMVATEVMEWEARMYPEGCHVHVPGARGFDAGPWSPSMHIAAAWEVVEKMAETYDVELSRLHEVPINGPTLWVCEVGELVDYDPAWYGRAPTAPHAICLAALRAVGTLE